MAVVGGGNSAAEESLLLTKFADHVTILVRGDAFTASQVIVDKVLETEAIDVQFGVAVQEFLGKDSKLNRVRVAAGDGEKAHTLDVDGAFIFIGLDPNAGFLEGSAVQRNQWGFIVTGHDLVHGGERPAGFERRDPAHLETSVPGIFAAGDVRAGSTKQVASAAGEGAAVALEIREYLRRG